MVFLSIWSGEIYGYMKCKDIGNLKHSYHNTPVGVDSSICLVGVWTCGNNLQDLTGFIGKTSRHQIASDRTVLCNGSLQPEAKTWITWSINPVADHVWGVFALEFSLRFVEYVQKRQWTTTETRVSVTGGAMLGRRAPGAVKFCAPVWHPCIVCAWSGAWKPGQDWFRGQPSYAADYQGYPGLKGHLCEHL